MTIGEKLEASKNGLDALLTYANGVTGADDTNIGDAVKTLADGFGGGGSVEMVTGSFVAGNEYIHEVEVADSTKIIAAFCVIDDIPASVSSSTTIACGSVLIDVFKGNTYNEWQYYSTVRKVMATNGSISAGVGEGTASYGISSDNINVLRIGTSSTSNRFLNGAKYNYTILSV